MGTRKEVKRMSAKCEYCGQIMLEAYGCTKSFFLIKGKRYRRIRVGTEHDLLPVYYGGCHDCSSRLGEYHHPGCDAERCPACWRQWIDCDCEDDCVD